MKGCSSRCAVEQWSDEVAMSGDAKLLSVLLFIAMMAIWCAALHRIMSSGELALFLSGVSSSGFALGFAFGKKR